MREIYGSCVGDMREMCGRYAGAVREMRESCAADLREIWHTDVCRAFEMVEKFEEAAQAKQPTSK